MIGTQTLVWRRVAPTSPAMVGAVLAEQHDEWVVAQHRYLSVESLAKVQMAVIENDEEVMPALAEAS